MNYKLFKTTMLQEVKKHFNEDTSIQLETVVKNNGLILDALLIREPNTYITPTLYLNDFFKRYHEQGSIDDTVQELLKTYQQHKDSLSIDMRMFNDFSTIQEHIVYRLINYEKNREFLQDVPHIPYLDLAVVFVCLFQAPGQCSGTITIHNQHMDLWKVSTSTLMQVASKNTPQLLPYDLRNMGTWLNELLPPEEQKEYTSELSLYVLTNSFKVHGACCILYHELLKKIAEQFASDIIILPSSIHEVLLIPSYCANTNDELNALVRQVNETEVDAEEILSDHIYYYDRAKDCVGY